MVATMPSRLTAICSKLACMARSLPFGSRALRASLRRLTRLRERGTIAGEGHDGGNAHAGLRLAGLHQAGTRRSVRPEVLTRGLIEGDRADFRKCLFGKAGFARGFQARQPIGIAHGVLDLRFQARVIRKMLAQPKTLFSKRQAQTGTAKPRLVAPFQQVQQQHVQAVDQFALLAPAQALDLFRDI
jgi:hypothetical protein